MDILQMKDWTYGFRILPDNCNFVLKYICSSSPVFSVITI